MSELDWSRINQQTVLFWVLYGLFKIEFLCENNVNITGVSDALNFIKLIIYSEQALV